MQKQTKSQDLAKTPTLTSSSNSYNVLSQQQPTTTSPRHSVSSGTQRKNSSQSESAASDEGNESKIKFNKAKSDKKSPNLNNRVSNSLFYRDMHENLDESKNQIETLIRNDRISQIKFNEAEFDEFRPTIKGNFYVLFRELYQ